MTDKPKPPDSLAGLAPDFTDGMESAAYIKSRWSAPPSLLALIDAELKKHPRGKTRAGDAVCFACGEWLWPCAAHRALSALRVTVEALEERATDDGVPGREAREALAAARKEMGE